MNLGVTTNDITFRNATFIDLFTEQTERLTSWGLPMTASAASAGNSQIITMPSFTISGWFYSCATTYYTVFCKQDSSGTTE